MILIPAIDIIGGECVRLTQGDYAQKKVYFRDPIEVAKYYFDNGFERLHVIDLDGAKASSPQNLKIVEKIKTKTNLIVQFGGGVKSLQNLESAFNSGADFIICGSVSVKEPDSFREWLKKYSGEKIILGADVKNEKISVNGWLEDTEIEIIEFISQFISDGLSRVICTDISKDGMLQGPNMDLYSKIMNALPSLKLTVSGGVSSVSDIEVVLEGGYDSVILGKALYENKIKIEELRKWLLKE